MSRFCVKCNKEIKPLNPKSNDVSRPEKEMWDGGIVDLIYAGYGSELDGDILVISICDDCAKNHCDCVGSHIG